MWLEAGASTQAEQTPNDDDANADPADSGSSANHCA